VSSQVKGAEVRLDGKRIGKTPLKVKAVPAGEHVLEVLAKGHAAWSRPILVKPKKGLRVRARLQQEPALVDVQCGPAGVVVTVDGTRVGEVPLAPLKLPPGKYSVACAASGWEPWSGEVSAPGGVRSVVGMPLVRKRGKLTLVSDVPGAEVTVGGTRLGHTPLEGSDVPVGRHAVRLRLEGYDEWAGEVVVQEGKAARLEARLTRLPGVLVVETTPQGAGVEVDGTPWGTTPLEPRQVTEGEHVVHALLDGHRPFERKVRVPAGGRARVEAALRPRGANLDIISSPAGATVLLDGADIGETPVRGLFVPPGDHLVVVDKSWHARWTHPLLLEDGASEAVAANLTTLGPAWGLAGTALVLAGGAAGTFLLAQAAAAEVRDDLDRYDQATSVEEIARHRSAAEDADARVGAWRIASATLLGLAAASGVGSALLFTTAPGGPPGVEAEPALAGAALTGSW